LTQLSREGFLTLYQSFGFSIIPIKPRDKRPSVDKWECYQETRATPGQIAEWFRDPALNVGVLCGKVSGNLVVLDFDSPKAYATYWDGKDPSEKTFVSKTGRGYQVWVRDPILSELTTKIDYRPFMDLEVRANSHYVVAPPSIHPSGPTYVVLGVLQIFEIPGLVDSVENRLRELGYQGGRRKWPRLKEVVRGVAQGERNNAAFVMSRFLLFTLGMPEQDAIFGLQVWNRQFNKPPLSDEELEQVLHSSLKYPRQKRVGTL
jgi:hypothetical protein